MTWLARKLDAAGAQLQSCLVKPWRMQHSERNPAKDPRPQTHIAVLYEGVLQACIPEKLAQTAESGVGSAKAYGFGLLSLAFAR
jgi:CRISPR system Cascade subunit CasE